MKKQWSGFIYENLIKKNVVEVKELKILDSKINNIERQLTSLLEGKITNSENNITFNVDKFKAQIVNKNFEEIRKRLNRTLDSIFYYDESYYRIYFKDLLNVDKIKVFIQNIETVIKKFKWSEKINISELIKLIDIKSKFVKKYSEIDLDYIIELNSIIKSIEESSSEEFSSLQEYLVTYLNTFYRPDLFEEKKIDDSDLPF